FQDARARPADWGPLQHERAHFNHRGITEDLNFYLVEIPGGIEGGIRYDTELFLPATAQLLAQRFAATLMAVAERPQQRIAEALAQAEASRPAARAPEAAPARGQDLLQLLERSEGVLLRHGELALDGAALQARIAVARARLSDGSAAVELGASDPV